MERSELRLALLDKRYVRTPEGARKYGVPIGTKLGSSRVKRQMLRASRVSRVRMESRKGGRRSSFYDEILSTLKSNEGFTVNAVNGNTIHRGYSVAMRPVSPYTTKIPVSEIKPGDVRRWMSDPGVSQMLARPNYRAGGWVAKDGMAYLDVVKVVNEGREPEALELGKSNDQISIFHLSTFTEIPTGGTGRPRGGTKPREAIYTETGGLVALAKAGSRLILFGPDDDLGTVCTALKGELLGLRMLRKSNGRVWVKPHTSKGIRVKGFWRKGRRKYTDEKGGAPLIDIPTPKSGKRQGDGDGMATMAEVSPGDAEAIRNQWNKILVGGKPVSKEQAVANIMAVYDEAPDEIKESGARWYQDAHDATKEWAKEAGISHQQMVGMVAVLSPSASWQTNMTMADFMAKALSADEPLTKEEAAAYIKDAKRNYAAAMKKYNSPGGNVTAGGAKKKKPVKPRGIEGLIGMKPSEIHELPQSPGVVAAVVRAKGIAAGLRTDPRWDEDGRDLGMRWQKISNMSKAINIFYADGDADSVDELIDTEVGGMKVRSFYNNIASPDDGRDVTIDSHAFGIMIGRPIASSDDRYIKIFAKGFRATSGTTGPYPLGADIYRNALDNVNELRRKDGKEPLNLQQLQAITWQQWRKKYPDSSRRQMKREGTLA